MFIYQKKPIRFLSMAMTKYLSETKEKKFWLMVSEGTVKDYLGLCPWQEDRGGRSMRQKGAVYLTMDQEGKSKTGSAQK